MDRCPKCGLFAVMPVVHATKIDQKGAMVEVLECIKCRHKLKRLN